MECRHDQYVRRPREAAERVGCSQFRIERDVGGHFAVIFEIDPLAVENLYRFYDPRRTLARWMAERGKREQREPRFVTEPARDSGGLCGDFGDLVRLRHLGHGGIGHEYSAAARDHDRHADHPMSGLRIDDMTDVIERDREIPG